VAAISDRGRPIGAKWTSAPSRYFRVGFPKINTTLMVKTKSSPLIDETIAFYTYAYRTRPKTGPATRFSAWEESEKEYYVVLQNGQKHQK
jgi:hypothetical protein